VLHAERNGARQLDSPCDGRSGLATPPWSIPPDGLVVPEKGSRRRDLVWRMAVFSMEVLPADDAFNVSSHGSRYSPTGGLCPAKRQGLSGAIGLGPL
jgi:hypothetical protein